MVVPLDQPLFVVILLEVLKGGLQLLDGVEGSDPEQVFLQRPYKALGTAVAFWGADKGGRGFCAHPCDLILEVMADV